MPIKIPNLLPATEQLLKENIFVMTETRAITQDIRPLHILMLNLMPKKIETETQIARLIGNTPLQVELELLQTATHKASHTSEEHMLAFYKTFDEIKHKKYDGMIITGAPVFLQENHASTIGRDKNGGLQPYRCQSGTYQADDGHCQQGSGSGCPVELGRLVQDYRLYL